MKKKMGPGGHKPDLIRGHQPAGESSKGGLTRKDGLQSRQSTYVPKEGAGKTFLGEVADDELEDALSEIDARLAENPADRDAHVSKYKVLRKLGERGKMRS